MSEFVETFGPHRSGLNSHGFQNGLSDSATRHRRKGGRPSTLGGALGLSEWQNVVERIATGA